MRKILLLGAAGGVASVLADRLLTSADDLELTLADLHPDRIRARDPRRTRTVRLDLFDAEGLRTLTREHDLVIHGAGPYIRTAIPVAKACLEARVSYLDFADDVEAFEAMLPLHEEASRRGICLLMGCGVSPGLTNVLVADLAQRFDEIERIDVAWASGDEGGGVMGRAVLEHVLHICGGTASRARNGRIERVRSMTEAEVFPMGGGLGERLLWEIAHPEPIMLGRSYPRVPLIRCFGGIDPPGVMAVVRGIGRAVDDGRLSRDEAIRFMQATMGGEVAMSGAWVAAIAGLLSGIGDGMVGARDAVSFAGFALLDRHEPFRGGIGCRMVGKRNGRRSTLMLRSSRAGVGTFVDSMARATGTCAAAFALVMLSGAVKPGLIFPEQLGPEAVYVALSKLGEPVDEMIDEPLTIRAW